MVEGGAWFTQVHADADTEYMALAFPLRQYREIYEQQGWWPVAVSGAPPPDREHPRLSLTAVLLVLPFAQQQTGGTNPSSMPRSQLTPYMWPGVSIRSQEHPCRLRQLGKILPSPPTTHPRRSSRRLADQLELTSRQSHHASQHVLP